MEQEKSNKEQTYKLKDVDVSTVGLVGRGANQKSFFLTKSDNELEEDSTMEEETKNPATDQLTGEEIKELSKTAATEATEGLWARLFKTFSGDQEDDVEDVPANEPQVLVIPEEIQKQLDRVDELAKSHQQLADELKEAKQELAKANSTAEERVFLSKADKLTSIGADQEELVNFMVFLNKSDNEKLEWFESFVKGVNAQLAEAGIYSEFGKQGAVEQDDDPIQALIKSGEAKDEREAYLKLGENQEAAQKLLAERRKEVRTG